MSGGHWNYEDQQIGSFGERLLDDGDPAVAALGAHLMAIAAILHDIDWYRSGDTSSYERAKLMALLPPASVIHMARERAEQALKDLRDAIDEAAKP